MAFDGNFRFDMEVDAFEKASAPEGRRRRIGGFVTTDRIDRQGERLIQKGLNFKPFIRHGWFNDNHGKGADHIVGYPEDATFVQKGDPLPSGEVSKRTGWYVEGYLLEGVKKADDYWDLARALQKSDRRIGFSVEGKVAKREERNGIPTVVEATIHNVAVTHCPVNTDTALEVLAKSMSAFEKALTASASQAIPGAATPGDGFAIQTESIEGCPPRKKKRKKRGLTKSEGIAFLMGRRPDISRDLAARIYEFTARSTAG